MKRTTPRRAPDPVIPNCPYTAEQINEMNRAHDQRYGFLLGNQNTYTKREIPRMHGRPDLTDCVTRDERDKAAWDAHYAALEKNL